MPGELDRKQFAVGSDLVAGVSENIAERLAGLDPFGARRQVHASLGAETAARNGGRAAGTKKNTEAKTVATGKRTSTSKAKTGKVSGARKPATRRNGKRNGGEAVEAARPKVGGTSFTGPTPGPEQKTVAQMLGEVVWLMIQSQAHKNFFLSDLEWLAMAPILLKQFRVFYAQGKAGQEAESAAGATGKQEDRAGTGTQTNQTAARPIGVVLWALVDEEVEKRLAEGNARLRPQDWRSGDRLWVVDIIAPFGGHDEMLKDLKSQVFTQRPVKFRAIVDGQPAVREM